MPPFCLLFLSIFPPALLRPAQSTETKRYKLEATFISMPQHVTADGHNKATLYLTKIWYIKRRLNYLCSKITKLMFVGLALRLSKELTEKRSFNGCKVPLTSRSIQNFRHRRNTTVSLQTKTFISSTLFHPKITHQSNCSFAKKMKPKHMEKSSQIRVENRHMTLSPRIELEQHLCHHCPNDNCDIHIVLIVLIAT